LNSSRNSMIDDFDEYQSNKSRLHDVIRLIKVSKPSFNCF